MSNWLKIVGGLTGCCECDQMTSPCDCASNGCVLECQCKGGIAELCGFAEFTAPSVPPKKYRRVSYSGTMTGSHYLDDLCTNIGTFRQDTIDGYCSYDVLTCALTNASTDVIRIGTTSGAPIALTCGPLGAACGINQALTPTTETRTGTGVCCPTIDAVGNPDGATNHSGTTNVWLTIEDTEDDAENRLLASMDWTPCDCLLSPTFRTIRLAGQFTFALRRVQVRAHAGASPQPPLIVGHDYEVTIKFYRRLLGSSGPWIFYGTDTVSLHATATDEYTPWIDMPIESGWETRAQVCALVDVSPPGSPGFTSPTSTAGRVGLPFSYTITATGSPTSFAAPGLPGGLSIDVGTGVISGTPTIAGTYTVNMSAVNVAGTSIVPLTITVAP